MWRKVLEKTAWTVICILVLVQDLPSFGYAQPGLPDLFGTDPDSSTLRPTTVHSSTEDDHSTLSAATANGTVGRTRRTSPSVLLSSGGSVTAATITASVTHSDNFTATTPKPPEASGPDLVLKACCGNHCVTYDNLMSMVGLQCCGDAPMNAFEKICCSKQIHVRHAGAKYFDRCCGDKPYAWDQVCCRGKVYDGVPQASCCGDLPYSIYDRTSICCGEQLHKIPPNTGSAVCCGDSMYDDRAGSHFCCGDKLYSRLTHNGCCHPYPGIGVEFPSRTSAALHPPPLMHPLPPPPHLSPSQRSLPLGLIKFSAPGQFPVHSGEKNGLQRQAEGYNSTTQLCCDRVYDRREFDFCCYVADVNAKQWTPPVPRAYSSKTHCCDGMTVFEMDPKEKKCMRR